MYNLQLSEEAIADYEEAVAWYEAQKPGLGAEFYAQLNEAFGQIETDPTSQRFLYENRRYTRLKQFPYKIFFLLEETTGNITVFAILHEKRHPDIWKNR